MKISLATWVTYRKMHGEYMARRLLGWSTKQAKLECATWPNAKARDPLAVIMALVHEWPTGSPADNRIQFACAIRMLLERSREKRLRLLGFCTPGVARRLLP